MRRYARPLVAVVFAGLLATPFLIRQLEERSTAHQVGPSAAERYGFRLEEVSKQVGIDFVHQGPTLDPALDHIMPEVASMGAAVSVVDFDRDGREDFYLTNSGEGSLNRLYRGRGDGTFEDVAKDVGLARVNPRGAGVSMGGVWGDYDNDGYEDLLLYRWGRQELFHNEGGERFVPVGEKVGLPEWANVNAAVWLDFDCDGRLDFLLAGYYPEQVDLWHLESTKMMPESFEYARNGGRTYLYRNLGGGRFEEASEEVGLISRRWALAAVAADLRGTGYPDVFIANDFGVSELYVNEGGRFHEAGDETGVGHGPKSGMNASVGDVLNRGSFAIYESNISEEGVLLQGNNLWIPSGEEGSLPRYRNMATAMGVDLGGWSFGAQFGDLNNDGHLDLYLANGYVSASRDESYWYDFSKIAGGHELVISDAKNWPPMKKRSLGGYQQKKVWINDGAGHFIDVAPMVGVTDRHDGRAVALADLWNRGVLDVIVANQRGPALVYRNHVAPGRDWIGFALEGGCDGEHPRAGCSNRSAIGARVTVYWNGKQQAQEVSGGSGFCSQNQRALHFGLGAKARIEKAVVRWPSGRVQALVHPEPNRLHELKEPT